MVAPPPARLRRRDAPGSRRGRGPPDPLVAPRGRLVGEGRRHARRPALVRQVPYHDGQRSLPQCFRLLPCPAGWHANFSGWSAPPLSISVWGGPRAGRSAAGGGASVRCGGPPISSVVSTVGSSRYGWAGGAGGVAAPPAGCAASQVWPSGTGVSPG